MDSEQMQKRSFTLVSFFALLLRYRKLILITLAVVVAIILVIYIVLPAVGVVVFRQPPVYQARIELGLPNYPAEARSAIDFDLPVWATRELRDTSRVRAAYEEAIGLPDGLDSPSSNAWISTNVLPMLSARWDSRTRVLSLTYESSDRGGISEFLKALETDVRQAAETRANDLLRLNQTNLASAQSALVQDLAQSLQTSAATLADAVNQGVASDPSLVLQYLRLAAQEVAIQMALDSDVLPWPADNVVTVTERPDDSLLASRGRGMALLFLMGIVFSVLLAIIADYISYVRNTPEEREKIERAMRNDRP